MSYYDFANYLTIGIPDAVVCVEELAESLRLKVILKKTSRKISLHTGIMATCS